MARSAGASNVYLYDELAGSRDHKFISSLSVGRAKMGLFISADRFHFSPAAEMNFHFSPTAEMKYIKFNHTTRPPIIHLVD
jgi:hypothetical protein